jgi:lipopolysaccharide transport system ATP-binding protein
MATAIKVENLAKAYQLGDFGTGTISRDLERFWAKLRGKEDPFLRIGEVNDRTAKGKNDIVWSLKDLNFEVQQGDAVGIVGRNGAGKSTLLKILSRVTTPTTGRIRIKGRIASLLEVGTGFHPELSGKENVYLNGAILGMRRSEIKRKFDEIVGFAGVERYIDTPVKRYSSGMYVRLAFAVAAHLESEILIVDEVLAVGDAEFQKKCLGKMDEVSRGEGRTVLFVSHNMAAVKKFCKRGIYLDKGMIRDYASIDQVIDNYSAFNKVARSIYQLAEPGGGKAAFASRIAIEDAGGLPATEIEVGAPWQVRISFTLKVAVAHFIIAFGISNAQDEILRTTWSSPSDLPAGDYEAVLREDSIWLATGVYSLSLGLSTFEQAIQYLESVASLAISPMTVPTLDKTILRTSGSGILVNPMNISIMTINKP